MSDNGTSQHQSNSSGLRTYVLQLIAVSTLFSACHRYREDELNVPIQPAESFSIDSGLLSIADSMQLWLNGMQLSNGLIETSYNSNLVSLYDNALAALVFIENADYARAESIFSYFDARIQTELLSGNGGFFQFRNAQGQPQGNRWLGDNAWLLIALNNYRQATGNVQFDELSSQLDAWLRSQQDADGGLWGGTDASGNTIGKVTEGMLDAFNAVGGFDSFHQGVLSYLQQERWDTTEQLLVSWPGSNYYYALDNFSWGYCALEGFPDRVLTDADRFKTTQLHMTSADSISGYCFDEDCDAVWMEGTAQMAVAFIKAGRITKANELLHEIAKSKAGQSGMQGAIGLPYASNIGTGYGGSLLWTGADVNPCTAATTWFIMAAHQFDPLALNYGKGIPAANRFW